MFNICMSLLMLSLAMWNLFWKIIHKKQNSALNGAWVAVFLFMAIKFSAEPLAKLTSHFFR